MSMRASRVRKPNIRLDVDQVVRRLRRRRGASTTPAMPPRPIRGGEVGERPDDGGVGEAGEGAVESSGSTVFAGAGRRLLAPRPAARRRRSLSRSPARSGAISTGTRLTSTPLVLLRSWTDQPPPRGGARRGSGRPRRRRARRRCRSPAPGGPWPPASGNDALLAVERCSAGAAWAGFYHGSKTKAEHGRAATDEAPASRSVSVRLVRVRTSCHTLASAPSSRNRPRSNRLRKAATTLRTELAAGRRPWISAAARSGGRPAR